MHRRALLLAPALLALPAHAQQQGDIAVSMPWTRAAGQNGTGAGFLAIANRGAAPDRLVGASSPVARVTEIHTHIREGDILRMRPVAAVDLPPGGTVTLQPGGFHLMLIGLKEPLIQGRSVPLTLRFERAGEIEVMLAVQPAGARGPMPHGH
ncbi:copper chaperone PCu(A)C [Dankookia sp. P2]|uniref:copper chaperone PCu(A)C n=1 Tax=Dankookia sp. P2 TaxID=3423955 RepID=UPI003D669140